MVFWRFDHPHEPKVFSSSFALGFGVSFSRFVACVRLFRSFPLGLLLISPHVNWHNVFGAEWTKKYKKFDVIFIISFRVRVGVFGETFFLCQFGGSCYGRMFIVLLLFLLMDWNDGMQ